MLLSDMCISPLDRGYLFADALYEVVPVFNASPVAIEPHHRRMCNTATALQMTDAVPSLDDWSKIIRRIAIANEGCAGVYYQLSRGAAAERALIPQRGEQLQASQLAMGLYGAPAADSVQVDLVEDRRWGHCNLKTTGLIGNVLARMQSPLDDVIMQRDGCITEASTSNVFALIDGNLCTPISDWRILPGITRELLIEFIKDELNIQVCERDISESELLGAEEVWLSSSLRGVTPVIRIGSKTIGNGLPGELWRQASECLMNGYERLSQAQI